jgi:aspartate/glutamate racemase
MKNENGVSGAKAILTATNLLENILKVADISMLQAAEAVTPWLAPLNISKIYFLGTRKC